MKNKIRTSLLVATLIINIGCSSTNNTGKKEIREDVKIAMDKIGYRCERTVSVGSHMKKKRCSTKKMRDAQKEAAVNSIERGQGGHATAGGDL